jgi:hypothetical protein
LGSLTDTTVIFFRMAIYGDALPRAAHILATATAGAKVSTTFVSVCHVYL